MRPLIGVPPCVDDRGRWKLEREYHYIDSAYARAIAAAGGNAVYLPRREECASLVDALDGLLLPGGDDLTPTRAYPAGVDFDPTPESQLRFDTALLAAALDRPIPVLAICYGMQLMALHLGGTLLYDIPTDLPHAASHRLSETDGRHPLQVEANSRLARILGPDPEPVNSLHHQGVADPGPRLRVAARAEDGVIEAIEADPTPASDAAFCIGVQWHPEKLTGRDGSRLFEAFVAACRDGRG